MFEQVESALNRQDYRTARNLIKTLVHNQPNNDLVHLYAARLQEATEHFDNAEKIYKKLLIESINQKVLNDSRAGIQRIQAAIQLQRKTLLVNALETSGGDEPGLLILEPVSAEEKTALAPQLAQIMKLDAYTARLHLPSRGWRLYRLGNMGELNFYQQQLKQAKIPGFCTTIDSLQTIEVVSVKLIQEFKPQAVLSCVDDHGAELRMGFAWSEVKQIVTGLLPIFEEITEVTSSTVRTTVQRKPKVLDYVQMCDLHIPSKNLIFRLCNQNYSFQKDVGERTSDLTALTSRENWQRLLSQIHEKTSHAQLWSDFTPFADTALAYPEMLLKITSHVQLMRRENSLWDQAFQMYSSLIFVKDQLNDGAADLN
jgi:tetratricopeptide (TPR) repeat protein